MAYRIILLELVDDAQNEGRILCARHLAERFEAELVGIHVSLPPFVPVGYGEGAAYVGPEVFEAQREANRLVRERVEATFRRLCGSTKLRVRDIYEEGDPGEIIAEAARSVDLTVADTEPGVKGDTVSNVTKPATLETGAVVQVPLFVNIGERIKVDPRESRYISRA